MLPTSEPTPAPAEPANPYQKIEDHPPGYPRYAAMISSHPTLFVFRRFAAIRARMILHKQDRISQLEKQLQQVDRDEARPIQLSSYRRDANPERQALFEQLDAAITQYDDLSQRTRQALAIKLAAPWDIRNLKRWLEGFGCVHISETEYLAHKRDLMALGPADTEDFLKTITHKVEDIIIWVSKILRRDFRDDCSSDPDVYIFPDRLIKTASRSVLAILASSFLLIPIIILTLINELAVRLTVVLISNAVFVFVVSVLAEAKMGELFMAGAAYYPLSTK
ncbi:hypothetical protein F4680DRAFT_452081 [Xylaria scruposa]|nr:hypothetical protein F4680DRAFT_452081 [Xylaria scruposa]